MKALLDANVLSSVLLSRSGDSLSDSIARAIVDRRFTPVVSQATLDEMSNAIQKKSYLKGRISPENMTALVAILRDSNGIIAASQAPVSTVLRDANDDNLIWTARQHEVDILVSGDADVLAHAGQEEFSILSPRVFVAALKFIEDE